jgi:hypothetical protein
MFLVFAQMLTQFLLTDPAVEMKSTTSSITSVVKPVPKPQCGESCDCCGLQESCGCVVM